MTASESRCSIPVCVLVGVLMLARTTPSAAEIYKWVDESGTIHFSDGPPPGTAKAGTVEVLPETEHRPPAANPSSDSLAEPAPAEAAVAPSEEERPGDASSDQASDPAEDAGAAEIIVEGAPLDPVVGYRANSPRNRPGQPIRQPGPRSPRRR